MENEYKVEETQFGTKTSHPSYGTLAFSRRSGGATSLFGSSIEHRDTIAMTLYHADITRGLHEDNIYGNKPIAEVEMSYSQFAEAITSMNMGNGVPVTIRWIRGEGRIEPCPFTDKKQQFEEEFKHRLDKANETANQLILNVEKLFEEKKNLTKNDKNEILSMLTKIYQSINGNSDFMYRMFNEQMDKTTTEAKGEIEAFMQNKINSIAQAALVEQREQFLSLENPVSVPIEDNEE